MSKKINRAKLNKANDHRDYMRILLDTEYGMYWDEGIKFYPRYNKGTKKDRTKFFRKQKMSYQYRMYKTWKHNRKTQWKT